LRPLRIVGLLALVGGFLLLLPFFTTTVNPNVSLADGALLVLALGGLMMVADVFIRMTKAEGRRMVVVSAGWCIFSAGLLTTFAGSLLGAQVMCSCPAEGPCSCGVPLYSIMFFGGLVVSVAGVAITLVGTKLRAM